MDARDGCKFALGAYFFLFLATLIFVLFYSGIAVTTALERVTHTIEDIKGDEFFAVASGSENAAYLVKLERFTKLVEDSALGFTPFKVRIESKLALTAFYVIVSVAVTIYIELAL